MDDHRRLAELVRDRADATRPLLVGITGGVAVGKSTTASRLADLLAVGPEEPSVVVVGTDGFLRSNEDLGAAGLLMRKGFPESYDLDRLVAAAADLRAGRPTSVPAYSHVTYDLVLGEVDVVGPADVIVLEGLPVLQVPGLVDLGIYLDAAEADLETWFLARFADLRASAAAAGEPSFFRRFVDLSDAEADAVARAVWAEVNLVNLRLHIAPTKGRADVVVDKGPDHAIRRLDLRPVPGGAGS